MTAAIAIRDDTRDALQALAKQVSESQNKGPLEVEIALSDVIDGLAFFGDILSQEALFERIIKIAREN